MGGGGGAGNYDPPHWPANQNAEYEKYHVFNASETVLCNGIDSKNDLKNHILKLIFRGGLICQK